MNVFKVAGGCCPHVSLEAEPRTLRILCGMDSQKRKTTCPIIKWGRTFAIFGQPITRLGKVLSICLNLAFTFSPAVAAEQHYYLEYDTFRALTALVPEAPEPRLTNLPDGGFDLWSKGQMRLPAGDHLVEGDFNQDGHPDAALIFSSQSRRYLLIASQIQGRWVRQALIELQEQSGVSLDGDIIVLGPPPETFVAWDGHRYRMSSRALPPKAPAVAQSPPQSPTSSPATVPVPLGFFAGLTGPELRSVEITLSYLGPSEGSLRPLRFVAETSGDTGGKAFGAIAVPTALLQRLLEALQKPLAALASPTQPKPYPWLSVTMEAHGKEPTRIFSARLNRDDAKLIFSIFRETLESVRLARLHLQSWGCGIGLLPPGRATDVTDHVSVKINSSYHSPWDRVSKLLQQGRTAPLDVKVLVTNRSDSALSGPLSVVFNLSGNARVLEPDGTTCHTTPVGLGYVHLPLKNNRLSPGETVEMPIGIENPEKESLTFDIKVLGGPDPR